MGANKAPLALGKGAASPKCFYPTLLLITGGAKIPRQEAFRLCFHNLCFCPGGSGVLHFSLSPKDWASLEGSAPLP